MSLNTLRDLFHEQLKDAYSAEKQLTEALPKMVDAASSGELKEAFENHYQVTQHHFERVKTILDQMNVNPGSTKCEAMEGLITEGSDMANEDGDPAVRDAGLICAAQKIEHYEIATYGCLRAWAKMLGEEEIAETLQDILDQEYDADNTLDRLAESHLNQEAK